MRGFSLGERRDSTASPAAPAYHAMHDSAGLANFVARGRRRLLDGLAGAACASVFAAAARSQLRPPGGGRREVDDHAAGRCSSIDQFEVVAAPASVGAGDGAAGTPACRLAQRGQAAPWIRRVGGAWGICDRLQLSERGGGDQEHDHSQKRPQASALLCLGLLSTGLGFGCGSSPGERDDKRLGGLEWASDHVSDINDLLWAERPGPRRAFDH